MKPGLIFIFLLQCFFYIRAQEKEQEFSMGSSIKSDPAQTINQVNLLKKLPPGQKRGPNSIRSKDDKKYGRYGIDISHHQGNIIWSKFNKDTLPNKVHFIVVKATQGATLADNLFTKNFKAVKNNGYVAGAYHFYSQQVDPELQANNFIQHVSLEKGDMMPVLDIEKNCYQNCATTPDLLLPKNQIIKNLKTFIAKIEKHYNTKVIIYTGEAFYKDYLAEDFKDEFFWIAQYSRTVPNCFPLGEIDTRTNTCPKKGCWQYSQSGKLKGITGTVDVDYINNYYLSQWVIK